MKTCFLDSNILIYTADVVDNKRQDQAITILKSAFKHTKSYVISVQTLTEFSNVALKKLKMSPEAVCIYLQFFSALNTIIPDKALVRRGVEIKALYGIQYYDAMIVAAAERAGVQEIWTEDLNDGQYYCGMRAINPFKSIGPES